LVKARQFFRDATYRGIAALALIITASIPLLEQYDAKECSDQGAPTYHPECELFWVRAVTDPVAFFTAVLSVSTIGLWIVTWSSGARQGRETRQSLKISRTAAIAAKKAAEALPILERGRLYVTISDHSIHSTVATSIVHGKETINDRFQIRFFFTNYGKTPAIIREISYGSYVDRAPKDNFVYTVHRTPLSSDVIGAGDETDVLVYYGNTGLVTISDAAKLANGELHVWFYGEVDYIDVFGSNQVHRYLKRCVVVDGVGWLGGKNFRFQSYDYKHYNQST
jgi:hypothetical protein